VFQVRALQAWWLFLILCLAFGISNISRENIVPSLIGLAVNLCLQFSVMVAIRKRNEALVMGRTNPSVLSVLGPNFYLVITAFAVLIGIDTSLFVSHIFSPPAFALFAIIITAALAVIALTRSFSRMRNAQR
jgi:hypothetical protein